MPAALALWRSSASKGNPEAQHLLATHYSSKAFLAGRNEEGGDGAEDEAAAAAEVATEGSGAAAEPTSDPGTPAADTAAGASEGEALAIVHDYFAALGGSLAAQMALGYRYLHGYGVVSDCDKALPYYELAANQAVASFRAASGRYPGQIMLPPAEPVKARLSELGSPSGGRRSSKETDNEVVQYYEAAAIAGDPTGRAAAALQLGNLYLHGGRGLRQDPAAAAKMYERAAAGGDTTAMGILGTMKYGGVGFVPSASVAAQYWRRGEKDEDPASMCGMGLLYLDGVPEALPPIEQDRVKAISLLEKSGKKGYMEGLYQLGMLHLENADVASKRAKQEEADRLEEKKAKRARELEVKRRQQNRRIQRQRQGNDGGSAGSEGEQIFREGDEVDPRSGRTIVQLEASAEVEVDAEGNEVPGEVPLTKEEEKRKEKEKKELRQSAGQEMQKALQYLSTAAQHGHLLALHQVGVMYSTGQGVARSCPTAVHAFKTISERSPHATSVLASALELWRSNDHEGARLLYAHGAELGLEIAQSNAAWLLERGELSFFPHYRARITSLTHRQHPSRRHPSRRPHSAFARLGQPACLHGQGWAKDCELRLAGGGRRWQW